MNEVCTSWNVQNDSVVFFASFGAAKTMAAHPTIIRAAKTFDKCFICPSFVSQ